LEATVATCFQMLRMQELGQEANKAEHNRRLLEAPAGSPMVGRCQQSSQYASIKKLVDMLKTEYGLSNADIYEHDKISYKIEGVRRLGVAVCHLSWCSGRVDLRLDVIVTRVRFAYPGYAGC
jgi:hypothetical protein